MSSGSDPHLLALLRAIRLREAGEAGDQDAGQAPHTPDPAASASSAQSAMHPAYPKHSEPPPAHPALDGAPPKPALGSAPTHPPPGGALAFPTVGGSPANPAPSGAPVQAGPPPNLPANQAFGGVPANPVPGLAPARPAPGGSSDNPDGRGPGGSTPGNPPRSAADPIGSRAAAPGPPARPPTPHIPILGGVISGGAFEPVQAVTAIGRPVPGQWPEQPNPGLLFPGVRSPGPVSAPHGPAPIVDALPASPADGMNPVDDAALREVQRLLGNSLSMAGGPEDVATRLRAALVQAQPQLMALVPGGAESQREQLAQALIWLVHHLDDPPTMVAGCVQLGSALAECGVRAPQLTLVGAALAEAMRAGMAAGGWRQDFDQAWRTTWQHVHEWITHGAAVAGYQPTTWLSVVESHELRRPDLAVVRFRPYLPMPFRPGQYARIEIDGLPGVWRPYSLAGAPRRDNIVELHVRAKTESGVSGTLVYRTGVGDKVRFARAEGEMGLPGQPDRDLLMVAGDTGVAPLKALLTEMAATGDPRSAVLFWGVRDLDELYDIEDIARIARTARRVTVVPVVSEGDPGQYASGLVTDAIAAYGEWSGHEVYLAGPPLMLAATSAALQQLGVAPERIHHDSPEG